jgi:hypothetical protein
MIRDSARNKWYWVKATSSTWVLVLEADMSSIDERRTSQDCILHPSSEAAGDLGLSNFQPSLPGLHRPCFHENPGLRPGLFSVVPYGTRKRRVLTFGVLALSLIAQFDLSGLTCD